MARFIPSVLRNIHRLSWKESLCVEDYQRLRLRLFIIPFVVAGLSALLVMAYVLVTMGTVPQTFSQVAVVGAAVVGALFMAFSIWLMVVSIKVEVMRWRGLGLKIGAVLGMLLVTLLCHVVVGAANELGNNPEYLLAGTAPFWLYTWLIYAVFFQIGLSLLNYWTYFEETPLRPVTATQSVAFATTPGGFERVLLFILQTCIWFSILSVPMYFILSQIL